MAITTETYRMSPAGYFKAVGSPTITKTIGLLAILILIATMIGVIYDLRIVLLALIVAFIIIPFVIGHIYFSKLLTTDAQAALSPKHVEIVPEKSITEIFESADEENPPRESITRDWKEIKSRRLIGKNIVVSFRDTTYKLIIPTSAITPKSAIYEVVEITEE